MSALPLDILPFDFANATDDDYAAVNRHINRIQAESQPDDPPRPLAETTAEMKNLPPFVDVKVWNARDADGREIVASAVVAIMKTPENAHLAHFNLYVEPEYRRQGMARGLLRRVAGLTREQSRRLLTTDTNERIPAGEAFMQRLGAERGMDAHTNQLVLSELDTVLLERWLADAEVRTPEFALEFCDGPFPEDRIEAFSQLFDVMNTAPRDGLDMEDTHFTPEQIRQLEQSMAASGRNRWTLIATETSTGRLVGFTEVDINLRRPQIVHQEGTGVLPEFRGKGLGRWLKAAMLDRIRHDLPDARFLRTGNADSNAAMLAINQALGFKPYMSRCVWQIETNKVLAYLGE